MTVPSPRAGDGVRAAETPPPERFQLASGLTVVFREHRAAEVAAVQLWVGVGARDEADAESGLSHFIEHLLFKGTPTRGPGVIDRTISAVGGEMNAATAQDFTYYHVVLPARHLGTALEVVADAARHAAFDAAELERERQVVLEEIRRAHDNPGSYLWRVMSRRHFAGHPYGRDVLGTPESIEGAPRQRIVDYYRRHYRPNNAALVVVGSLDARATAAGIERAFAGWEPGAMSARPGQAPPGPPEVVRAQESRPLAQAYVGVAWLGPTVPSADVYTMDLLASILGRGRTSRLYQGLKERRGLVTSVGGTFYALREAGMLAVTVRMSPGRHRAVEAALLEEVERLRTDLVDETEHRRALTAVEADYAFGHETAEGLAHSYGLAETVFSLDFELTYLDRVRRVTREEIREAARRYLAPDRFTTALLAPEGPPAGSP
jgi:zinc protease